MTSLKHILIRVRDTWAGRDEPEHMRALAEMYWLTILALSGLVVLFAALYGGIKFFAALEPGETGSAVASQNRTLLDRGALKAVVEGFARRDAEYESLKTVRPSIADPSK